MSPDPAWQWVLLAVLGAAVALDQDAGLGLHLSQPLVAGALAGLVEGRLEAGVAAGGVVQLVWMAAQPVGGARLPDLGLGGIAAALTVPATFVPGTWLATDLLAAPAVVGVAAAWGGGLVLRRQRTVQGALLAGLSKHLERGDAGALARLHELSLLLHAARGATLVLLAAALAPGLGEFLAALGVQVEATRLAAGIGIVTLWRLAGPGKKRLLLAGVLVGFLPGVL